MRKTRRILLFAVLLLAVIGAWIWWSRPREVDMSAYAPADSLLYLEANHPLEILEAITGTQAWKAFGSVLEPRSNSFNSPWLQRFMRLTGIGPSKSVILARAQMAVVVTDLHTAEEGENLNIKPEGALLVETHTAESRITPAVEEVLQTLAEKTYGQPAARRVTVGGTEYVEWFSSDGSRQIVGAVLGSLVVIGTSEHVVQTCLAVAQGRSPSLKGAPELHAVRQQVDSGRALTFGYVPTGSSAKLLAVGMPMLLGRAPGDSEFQRLITNGAAKVFGSLAWTSRAYLTGIEDRYLISIQPTIVARLKPSFSTNTPKSQMQRLVPNDVYSVTSYKFANPAAAWLSLKTAVSSQVDALSAVVFSSLLKSALVSYGIDDPDAFLGAVDSELLTLRLDDNAERSLLIARVRDRAALRQLVTKHLSQSRGDSAPARREIFEDPQGEFAAGLSDEFIVIGSPRDLRRYYEITVSMTIPMSAQNLKKLTSFDSATSANVVTYTDDKDRVRGFISAILTASGKPAASSESYEAGIAMLPYSVTKTTLVDGGLERVTRSPLGQFSSLLPLLFPQRPASVKEPNQSR